MSNRARWLIIVAMTLFAFLMGAMISFWLGEQDAGDQQVRTETVREQPINNNKTVPLKETHTENNHYYTQPCKLPNTGGEQ